MKKQPPLIIGNWKMNPRDSKSAVSLVKELGTLQKKQNHATVVIAPPIIYLAEVSKLAKKYNLSLAVQNIHKSLLGAFTGEHSLPMVLEYGVKYVILGHSERRASGESDADITGKIEATLKAKCQPIVCIGEKERDGQGNFFLLIEEQIKNIFTNIPKARFKDIILAYEPIWAIGTGATATVEDVVEMQIFIQKTIAKYFGRASVAPVRIIYGGSVKPDNAKELFESKVIDGFLVGGASLNAGDFNSIINATK